MITVHTRAADEALNPPRGMAMLAGLRLVAARAQLAVGFDLVVVCGRCLITFDQAGAGQGWFTIHQ